MAVLRETLVEARKCLLEFQEADGWDNHTVAGLRAAKRLSELPGAPMLTPESERLLLSGDYIRFCFYHHIPFRAQVYLDVDGTVSPLEKVPGSCEVIPSWYGADFYVSSEVSEVLRAAADGSLSWLSFREEETVLLNERFGLSFPYVEIPEDVSGFGAKVSALRGEVWAGDVLPVFWDDAEGLVSSDVADLAGLGVTFYRVDGRCGLVGDDLELLRSLV